jgi:uncharacterized protein (DUF1697 family)
METSYVALLRGINVGGKNIIKMETLKQCFVDMGFSDVKTYIQSGNVIFKTQKSDKLVHFAPYLRNEQKLSAKIYQNDNVSSRYYTELEYYDKTLGVGK